MSVRKCEHEVVYGPGDNDYPKSTRSKPAKQVKPKSGKVTKAEMIECHRCGGFGMIAKYPVGPDEGSDYMACPKCTGTGRVRAIRSSRRKGVKE
jgi:DnaJ-class molecular chaperone